MVRRIASDTVRLPLSKSGELGEKRKGYAIKEEENPSYIKAAEFLEICWGFFPIKTYKTSPFPKVQIITKVLYTISSYWKNKGYFLSWRSRCSWQLLQLLCVLLINWQKDYPHFLGERCFSQLLKTKTDVSGRRIYQGQSWSGETHFCLLWWIS